MSSWSSCWSRALKNRLLLISTHHPTIGAGRAAFASTTPADPQAEAKKLSHYMSPRNVGWFDQKDPSVGTGVVGSAPCGDILKFQIKVDRTAGKIVDAKFTMYGCGSSIACCSFSTEWLKGKTLDEAGQLHRAAISDELRLPRTKLHCSSLAQDSVQAALNDYQVKLQKRAQLDNVNTDES